MTPETIEHARRLLARHQIAVAEGYARPRVVREFNEFAAAHGPEIAAALIEEEALSNNWMDRAFRLNIENERLRLALIAAEERIGRLEAALNDLSIVQARHPLAIGFNHGPIRLSEALDALEEVREVARDALAQEKQEL